MSKKSNDESKGGDRHYHNNIHVIENNILRKNLLGMYILKYDYTSVLCTRTSKLN